MSSIEYKIVHTNLCRNIPILYEKEPKMVLTTAVKWQFGS